jgi:hypothetical protein
MPQPPHCSIPTVMPTTCTTTPRRCFKTTWALEDHGIRPPATGASNTQDLHSATHADKTATRQNNAQTSPPCKNQTQQVRQQGPRSTECYTCGQQGHQSRYCPNKHVQQNPAQQGRHQGRAFHSPTRPQRQHNPQQHTATPSQYNAMPPPQALSAQQQTPFGNNGGPMGPQLPRMSTPIATTTQPVTFSAANNQVSQQQVPAQQPGPRANGTTPRPPRACQRPGCNQHAHHLKDCPNYAGCDHCSDHGHLVQRCPKMTHLNLQGRR